MSTTRDRTRISFMASPALVAGIDAAVERSTLYELSPWARLAFLEHLAEKRPAPPDPPGPHPILVQIACPADLRKRIDSERGETPLARWTRGVLWKASKAKG